MHINKSAKKRLTAPGCRGMTAMEIIIVLVVITIITAIFLLKGGNMGTDNLRAAVLLKNMEFVAHSSEEQKRHLGFYPTHVKALKSKEEYLKPDNNSGGITDEELLHSEWEGPYIMGLYVKDDKFMLDNIMPGKKGAFITDENHVYYELEPFSLKENAKMTKLYKKCSMIDTTATITLNTVVNPNDNEMCGYEANRQHITKFRYYVGPKAK